MFYQEKIMKIQERLMLNFVFLIYTKNEMDMSLFLFFLVRLSVYYKHIDVLREGNFILLERRSPSNTFM